MMRYGGLTEDEALKTITYNGAVQLGVQYVLARLIVGTLVGFVWNFPMHRYFVFRP